MNKVITLGGGFIASHLPYQNISTRLDTNIYHIDRLINNIKPDVIINCIGKTGRPNVDWCETNQIETASANTAMPILLADACAKHSIHLIQIGSGCIYFGKSPNLHYLQNDGSPMPPSEATTFTMKFPTIEIDQGWYETDLANPKSFYSKSKYASDLAIGQMDHVAILRIRMPVSERNQPRNLINKLKGYSQIINIPNSMTFMIDFIRCVEWVIENGHTGIWHVVNPGTITAVQIMQEYQKYVPSHTFDIIYTENQLDKLTIAKRSNCILNTDKLTNAGFEMSPANLALQQCMKNYFRNQNVQ